LYRGAPGFVPGTARAGFVTGRSVCSPCVLLVWVASNASRIPRLGLGKAGGRVAWAGAPPSSLASGGPPHPGHRVALARHDRCSTNDLTMRSSVLLLLLGACAANAPAGSTHADGGGAVDSMARAADAALIDAASAADAPVATPDAPRVDATPSPSDA